MEEKALWLGVLIQATADIAGSNQGPSRNARAWFESMSTDSGSYRSVCATLGLDPRYYRSRVLKIAETNPRQLIWLRRHAGNVTLAGASLRAPS